MNKTICESCNNTKHLKCTHGKCDCECIIKKLIIVEAIKRHVPFGNKTLVSKIIKYYIGI